VLICGVDPGALGAMAFLDAETRRVLAIVNMPMAGASLLVRELVLDIEGALDGRRVGSMFIEKQAPFAQGGRSAGASSCFAMGERFMAPRAIAACLGWPVEIVPPAKWQRHFGIHKADKAKSLLLANEFFPLDCGSWKVRRGFCNKAQGIGRAESCLIGLYGIRTLAGIATKKREFVIPGLADLPNDAIDNMIDEAAAE
jgi:hypothetical protein